MSAVWPCSCSTAVDVSGSLIVLGLSGLTGTPGVDMGVVEGSGGICGVTCENPRIGGVVWFGLIAFWEWWNCLGESGEGNGKYKGGGGVMGGFANFGKRLAGGGGTISGNRSKSPIGGGGRMSGSTGCTTEWWSFGGGGAGIVYLTVELGGGKGWCSGVERGGC